LELLNQCRSHYVVQRTPK